ncbi:MAG: tRNA (adenosine(37)-N6)-threonylcarbamoyltransferase complex transferase subunit TsaD [Verrucomicrobia bacterium]|nr:MAG: tRNA (adenosine(37)-N6)-threonylcarbamoyltransferase complex transferase subunit TsaD [Verrucomicrobiota bacterium]
MLLLAFETSCDETSVAVVRDGVVLSNIVASQVRLHAAYGGVVPELATREHLRNLAPVARRAMESAGVNAAAIEAVAATRGPGLPAALMAGYTAARAFASARGCPMLGIHHHEAHLYSPWVAGEPPRAEWDAFEPNVSLIVSGGHTLLVHVPAELRHRVLGGTIDDAAGECFDKVSKLLGLPYPGGPILDRLAEEGRADAFDFPRPLRNDPSDDFSFSGLKTSVRYFLEKRPGLADDPVALRDVCASVRAAIVDTLVAKTVRAARRMGVRCVTASGGVTCNLALRRGLEAACGEARLRLRLAPRALCTDNAAMVGLLAARKLGRGAVSDAPDLEADPGWALG